MFKGLFSEIFHILTWLLFFAFFLQIFSENVANNLSHLADSKRQTWSNNKSQIQFPSKMSCPRRGDGKEASGDGHGHHHGHGHCHGHHQKANGNCEEHGKGGCGHSDHDHSGVRSMANSVKHVGVEGLLGCGNSAAIAELKIGQTVIDLGSGSGLDCIAAAGKVGPTGKVIGIDSSPEMIAAGEEKAKAKGLLETVINFKLGQMENMPVDDGIADVVMSSFALNHSKDKPQLFRDTARVLKSGGLIAFVDIVATTEIPEEMRTRYKDMKTCIFDSSAIKDLKEIMVPAGFENINVKVNEESRPLLEKKFQIEDMQKYFAVAHISATKS